MNHEQYKVTVPEGQKGIYKIERFEIDEKGASLWNVRALINKTGREVKVGTYTRLVRTGSVFNNTVMSDTPSEIDDHWEVIRMAKGHVLIHGLGIGAILQACLRKEQVTHCTVIEKALEVIELVAPHYQNMFPKEKLTIIHDDALLYKPPRGIKYGAVWSDIWDNICADNWETMKLLKKKYANRSKYRWHGCWCEDEVRNLAFIRPRY